MSVLTQFLNLFKAEPIVDGNAVFNITTMLNENWDKVDHAVKTLDGDIKEMASSTTYLQEEEPIAVNPSTVWYSVGSETNFNLGGVAIYNAKTSETPPE
ncbi:hypothetical protein [Fusibacter sp. 3D3]|uniref:hypothetical protein n=1 Tax=Fusibacter sp. 3D3 TaxID=1048380 RepID=UPI000853A09F|nr:hypothetical protein [Fusibacter sp. 3D3]GAU79501.1 hypothetical protein F3D3_4165 [Fusibacter sp. 3D3]